MSGLMKIYNYIEQTFFFTLTRKIVGNLSFVFLFQAITLFWLYDSLSEQQNLGLFWLLTLVIISGFAFTLFYMRFLIVRPVKAMCDTLIKINQQDANLNAKLPHFSYDEFKTLSTQYNDFTSHLSQLLNTTYTSAEASAQSNKAATESMQSTENSSEQQITLSHTIIDASNQITQSLQNIVGNTDSVHTVNNEHLAFVKLSAQELSSLVEKVQLITDMLGSFASTVDGLKENSENIRSILKMVEEFSDQTNLLALNAAIEAARAGEYGRGFAVVADEVRSLASKTQESTQEIQSMIESLQTGAEAAVTAMTKGKQRAVSCVEQTDLASTALDSITFAVSQAHDVSEEISTAALEQQQVAEEISERLESIVAIAEQTAEGASQTNISSSEVAKLAEELRLSVDEFKV